MSTSDTTRTLPIHPTLREEDDLRLLKRLLPDGEFHYIDITTEQARELVRKRWPLIAELSRYIARQHLQLDDALAPPEGSI